MLPRETWAQNPSPPLGQASLSSDARDSTAPAFVFSPSCFESLPTSPAPLEVWRRYEGGRLSKARCYVKRLHWGWQEYGQEKCRTIIRA
jgi:hypothetical protein